MNYKNKTFAFVRVKEEGGFQVDCWHHSNVDNECHVVERHATTMQEVNQIKREHYKRKPVKHLITWSPCLKKYTITYLYEGDEVSSTGEVTRKS